MGWSHAPLHHELQISYFVILALAFGHTHTFTRARACQPGIIELWHDRNNKTGVRTSKDPKQPGHPPSMVRFFTARPWATKGLGIFTQKVMTSITLRRRPGRPYIAGPIMSCRGSYHNIILVHKMYKYAYSMYNTIVINLTWTSFSLFWRVGHITQLFCSIICLCLIAERVQSAPAKLDSICYEISMKS